MLMLSPVLQVVLLLLSVLQVFVLGLLVVVRRSLMARPLTIRLGVSVP